MTRNAKPTKRTMEVWDKLVSAYRRKPNNHSHAAREAGVDRRMSAKAFEHGWRAQGDIAEDLPPIKSILERDIVEIRARASKLNSEIDKEKLVAEMVSDRQKRQMARDHAMDQSSKEQLIVDATLMTTGKMLPTMQAIDRRMGDLSGYLDERIRDAIADETLTIMDAMTLLTHWVKLMNSVSSCVNSAVTLSRKVAGAPDQVVEATMNVTHELDEALAAELFGDDPQRVLAATKSLIDGKPNEDAITLQEALRERQQQYH